MRRPRQIVNYGSSALLLEWEQVIDRSINAAVHAYAQAARQLPAVLETVPAYCSLLITFDQERITAYQLQEQLYTLRPSLQSATDQLHRLPVVYGGSFGPDLAEVADSLQLSPDRVIQLHTATEYQVYQLGYQPGFAFLGETAPELEIARKANPRPEVVAGSVGLAGRQTGVYPQAAPGGWQLIGRCPWPLVRVAPAPFMRLKAGDRVQFFPIAATEWAAYQQNPGTWTS